MFLIGSLDLFRSRERGLRFALAALTLTASIPTASAQSVGIGSLGPDGIPASRGAFYTPLSLSFDARYIAFAVDYPALDPADTDNDYDIFIGDRQLGTIARLPLPADRFGALFRPHVSISADGRLVAFDAPEPFVPGRASRQVYVFDRTNATTQLVSVVAGGTADGDSLHPSISADGRYVAFVSRATNLVAADTNGLADVFVRDRTSGITIRDSVSSTGAQSSGSSWLDSDRSLSADGRYLVFRSGSSNLVLGDTNARDDVFLRDRVSGTTTRVSVDSGAMQATGGDSGWPAISNDGAWIVFESTAGDLVTLDTNAQRDVFLHHRPTGATTRVSVATGGGEGSGGRFGAGSPSVNADGSAVVFHADFTNLVAGDTNDAADVFLHARVGGATSRVSVPAPGAQAVGGPSAFGVVSDDGRTVVFGSGATNLVAGDTNLLAEPFAQTVSSGAMARVAFVPGGGEAGGPPFGPSLTTTGQAATSADGRFIAFTSTLATLVLEDVDIARDVFVHDKLTRVTTLVSAGGNGRQSDCRVVMCAGIPAISADGRFVAFVSSAEDLVPADTNGKADVFVHDRLTRATSQVSLATSGAPLTGGPAFHVAMSGDGRHVAFDWQTRETVSGNEIEVFVHDRQVGATTLVSALPNGSPAADASGGASVSSDGRYVAFASWSPALVPADTNNAFDVFVRDVALGLTTRVSVTSAGTQGAGASFRPAMSANGQVVAFLSDASNLAAGDSIGTDVFVHDRVPGLTTRASVASGGGQANAATDGLTSTALSADGRYLTFSSAATNLVPNDSNAATDVFVHDRTLVLTSRVSLTNGGAQTGYEALSPSMSADGLHVSFETAAPLAPDDGPFIDADAYWVDLDGDGDGLPSMWETAFGLNALVGTGADGASGDPDGDGRANANEYLDGTHPRAFVTRYFAEGASSSFFETRLALLNPGALPAHVLLRFQRAVGGPLGRAALVGPHSRATLLAGDVAGLGQAEFSTVVESDEPIVADRLMRWDSTGYGTHLETALLAPSSTWYFAEGATHSGFSLFYLLQNPSPTTVAQVRVTFLKPSAIGPGTTIQRTYDVPPLTRMNVWVNLVDPALAATDVAAEIRVLNDVPILAERAMYRDAPRFDPVTGVFLGQQFFGAGHSSAGVPAPALEWFLAEGATGALFDEFLLLLNPTDDSSLVRITYYLQTPTARGGYTSFEENYVVQPKSRRTIWTDREQFSIIGNALENAEFSVKATVTNDVPIVVERAMWWPGSSATWWEAHSSVGVTQAGTRWALAEGELGMGVGAETYVLIANTSELDGQARLTVYFEDGTTRTVAMNVPSRRRVTVPIAVYFPEAANKRFGALVESLGASPASLVVERAMYSDAAGVHWAAGGAAPASRLSP
jgi:Tol biopolymer transport system component